MSDLHELRQLLEEAAQGMVPSELKEKGWRYLDFPTKFSPQAWDWLLLLMGEGEYQLIISSSCSHPDGTLDWIRGQFFVSPQGYANLTDENRRKEIPFPTHPGSQQVN